MLNESWTHAYSHSHIHEHSHTHMMKEKVIERGIVWNWKIINRNGSEGRRVLCVRLKNYQYY